MPCTILLAGDFLCHHLDQLMNICLCIFAYSYTNTHTNTNNFSITREEHIFQGQHLFLFSLTLWSPGLKHDRLLCPSLSPRVCSNSCPLSRWCYLTISTSATLSSCLQSFPASESFTVSQLFASGGQSTGALASASVLPMNIQSWFSLGLTGLIFLQSKELSAPQFESINSLAFSLLYGPTHWYMTTGKTMALTKGN